MSWVRRAITVLFGFVLVAAAILYGGSALVMRRDVNAALPRITASTDPAGIAEGARLAAVMGCTRCHGDNGQGRIMTDVPALGQIIAPSLAQVAARSTDGQLARAIRNGVGIDARPLYIMPSYSDLSDEDVSRLMGWISILPTSAFDVVGNTPVGLRGRFAILTARLPDSVDLRTGQPARRPADVGPYLAQAACGQCHGAGDDLARSASTYDAAALRTLLRTGKGKGNRALPVMTQASKTGLGLLTDAEIDAISAHLTGRAKR